MSETRTYGGLDAFKLAAALLVVAIHTSPLGSISPGGDFFLTRVLARVAVPFFFLVTGQFVLGDALFRQPPETKKIRPYCRKVLLLYGCTILLYLPLGLYAGHYTDLTPAKVLRLLVFDGTFYHLWYFPACVTGILLLTALRRVLSERGLFLSAGVLYLLGLLGDSYYGLTAQIPLLSQVYDGAFHVFSYTRNGLFFAPLFLLLGAWLGKRPPDRRPKVCALGLLVSLAAMTAEAFTLRHFGLQRHDSMYLLLPVVMVFLYQLLLTWDRKPSKLCRTLSTVVYLIHPAMIVVVRGLAGVLGRTALLVDNSLVHYGAVCLFSLLAALAATKIFHRKEGIAL